jgi:hypothetical protein
MQAPRQFHVFLQYRRFDEARALELAKRLESDGLRVWLDKRDIRPGDDWAEQTIEARKSTRVELVLVSKQGLESGMLKTVFDLGDALEERRVVLLRLDDFEIPATAGEVIWMDWLSGSNLEYGRILDACRPDFAAVKDGPGSDGLPLSSFSRFEVSDETKKVFEAAVAVGRELGYGELTSSTLVYGMAVVGSEQRTLANTTQFFWSRFGKEGLERLTAELARSKSNRTPSRMGPNFVRVLESARKYSIRVGTKGRISARHLLAALLQFGEAGNLAQFALKSGLIPLPELRKQFFDFLVQAIPTEANAWAEILQGKATGSGSPTQMHLAARLHSDLWTLQDRLGYSLYAQSIVEFLLHRDTSPPLTVGILAPWGQGKTTLMHLIREAVEKKQPKPPTNAGVHSETTLAQFLDLLESSVSPPTKLQYPTVWFNAWTYQSCEQLWAGMAHAIISQLVDKLPSQLDKENFWLRLQLKRIDIAKVRKDVHRVILERALPRAAAFAALGVAGILVLLSAAVVSGPSVSYLRLGGGFGAAVSLVGGVWKWMSERKKSLAKTLDGRFDKYVRQPDYESKMGFFYQMQEDLRRVFDLLVDEKKPLIVFVDDVDRCTPGKAAELIEAINMFLSGDYARCYFVIGMDAQVVATSLDVANEKLSEKLKHFSSSMGWCFMEKFIQFPFMIPNLSEPQQAEFIETLYGVHGQRTEQIDVGEITRELNEELASQDISLMPDVDRADKLKMLLAANEDSFREMSSKFLERGASQFSDEDESLKEQLLQHRKYLENSPRTFKRFANLFRFYRFYEWSRELQGLPTATTKELGMWVTLMLRWPGVVRLVQWKASTEGIKGLSPTMKAKMLDGAAREARDYAQWKETLKSQNLQEAVPAEDAALFNFLNESIKRDLSIERAVEAGIW